eukprot:GEMP01040351.1.p1 GENE.GEMP01040351.1~~GEMP01040351.1.p1  ORF type:complete len:296 (+),score=48.57 GEMP01040351.1:42-890(+)
MTDAPAEVPASKLPIEAPVNGTAALRLRPVTAGDNGSTRRPRGTCAGHHTMRPATVGGAVSCERRGRAPERRKSPIDYDVRQRKRPSTSEFWSRNRHEFQSLNKIEHLAMAVLYDGSLQGGSVSSLNARTIPFAYYKTLLTPSLKPAVDSVAFTSLVNHCDDTRDATRNLFQKLQQQERKTQKSLDHIAQTLEVMRSLPDLTVSREEFAEAMEYASNQRSINMSIHGAEQKRRSHFPVEKTRSASHTRPRGIPEGSIRHIFPLVDFQRDRVVQKSGTDNWRW